ncbi:glutathione peroxidase [Platysternon megacephalum]|uniref:Glutathione peroxidase n=1 Tax=Platysternon megacephalum TaxID=55544 RepID=A0A4D9DCJ7_9SAUR|nr:glutathione peroxidase [Platysternon megacephalum]
MGRIARELAKRAHALGMNIIYTDILGKAAELSDYEFGTQDDVLAKADFISIHIPKPSDRDYVLGAEEIATMKDGVYLINTARGGLIEHEALIKALDEGKVAGAALDVFPTEPVPADQDAIVKHPKVSVTPHIGASTGEAQTRIGEEVVSIIVDFFDGK